MSSIVLLKDGKKTTLPNNPSGLDRVAVYNDSTGLWETRDLIFGTDFAESSKLASETTTGATFAVYDTLNFTVSEPTGTNKYRVSFNYFWGHDLASNDIRVEHRLNGSVIENEMRKEPKDVGGDQRIDGTFVAYLTNLSQGVNSLSLAYRPATASRVSRMYRSVIEVWRVE